MQEKTTIFYLLPLFWNNYTKKKEASCWKPLVVGAEGFEPPTLCL